MHRPKSRPVFSWPVNNMNSKLENGYISQYLIHWTGKGKDGRVDDVEGARILSIIASTRKLRLSYNPIYKRDMFNEIHEKMRANGDAL